MFLDFINKVEAPVWFQEEMKKVREEQKNNLIRNYSLTDEEIKKVEEFKERHAKGEDIKAEKDRWLDELTKLHSKEIEKNSLIENRYFDKYIQHYIDFVWSKYRYENVKNKFGQAEKLHYDEKNRLIIIDKK